ncbi:MULTISPECIES: cell envelope integrity TolA C-terminal domain-containing protein [Pantoea]|uniref:Colicin transporter n=1 Tax=Pantoea vagans TaxID=470934 RepID=A0A0U3THP4_9GAMM|nr:MULTISPECIES: cell envelope integrity TolA C-terminal domain-containing protein [Pantoea]ALV93224.1 colicin transporter [Pantoea vagans]
MNFLTRFAGLLALVTLLSACQHATSPAPAPVANLCQPQTQPGSASCKWADEMQHHLNRQFQDAARYAGQQCLVQLEWQNSGRYAVTQTQGDETLCLRAWQLIGQSKGLPPPPDRTQPAWFGFAPRKASSPAHPAATGAG